MWWRAMPVPKSPRSLSIAPPRGRAVVPRDVAQTVAARTSGREVQELVRLARTVLAKSPDDLAAIADDNAATQAGWIDAFATHRARAEAEARFWSAAIAYLMASAPCAVANDD
jgi:hypothetical protein